MKRINPVLVASVAMLTLLFTFMPFNIVAAQKGPTEVGLKVRNRTGGIVEIKLVNESGTPAWYRYEPGQTTTPLAEGLYAYYASTDCGNRSGTFNVNVTKELIFECSQGLQISLKVPTPVSFCYAIFDYEIAGETIGGSPAETFDPYVWKQIGTYCQSAAANQGDSISYYNDYWNGTAIYYFETEGVECYQGGPGYYYQPCPNQPK